MSELLSRIRARLETGQHLNSASSEDLGWVRAAVAGLHKEPNGSRDGVQTGSLSQEVTNGWQTGLVERMKLLGPRPQDQNESSLNKPSSDGSSEREDITPRTASQRFWETGALESYIPNGFYSIVPSKSLKARFRIIPSLDELKLLGEECSLGDVLLVDANEDKMLSKLREFLMSLVKSIEANPALIIKKIADLVADFYGGPLFEAGSFKHPVDEPPVTTSPRLLGEIKIGLCRPRALLFKFLGDAVGLHSRLLMGLQLEAMPSSSLICANPGKHLSNIVSLNDTELLVDIMRHPGHLRPFSRKALIMYHISGAGDSDSADYDSCDSPLEPNSPLFDYQDRVNGESPDHDLSDSPGRPLQRKSSPVTAGAIQSVILRLPIGLEGKLSPSRSEPDLANPYRRRSRRKAVTDEQAAAVSSERPVGIQPSLRRSNTTTEGVRSFPSSPEHPQARFKPFRRVGCQEGTISSPEHPAFRVRAPSMLGGSRRQGGDEGDCLGISSPEQSPQHFSAAEKQSPIFRRRRERSLSIDVQRDGLNVDIFRSGGELDPPRMNASPEVRKSKKKSGALEISDDVVRVVRAMNEAIKLERTKSRLEHGKDAEQSYSEASPEEHKDRTTYDTSNQTSVRQLTIGSDQAMPDTGPRKSAYGVPCALYPDGNPDVERTLSTHQDSVNREELRRSHETEVRAGRDHVVDSQTPTRAAVSSSEISAPSRTNAVGHTVTLKPPSWLQSPLMPYSEWNIDFRELRIGVRVGIGSFGEVFRGVWRGTEVAIKVMLEQDLTDENTADFCTEIALLSRLRHPNVILFLGACTTPPHLSMVTEYMHMGSLYSLIHTTGQGKKLSWQRRLKMLRDICRGMMSVQRMNIVHCDLKSANCLVDKHWCVKISDFGLSRLASGAPRPERTAAGTPEWMAPELLRNDVVTDKCDIFSLGVIMWEFCTLKKPWDGVKPMQVVLEVAHKQARLDIPQGLLGKLISDCWAEDPALRPTYEEILTRLHEYEFLQG